MCIAQLHSNINFYLFGRLGIVNNYLLNKATKNIYFVSCGSMPKATFLQELLPKIGYWKLEEVEWNNSFYVEFYSIVMSIAIMEISKEKSVSFKIALSYLVIQILLFWISKTSYNSGKVKLVRYSSFGSHFLRLQMFPICLVFCFIVSINVHVFVWRKKLSVLCTYVYTTLSSSASNTFSV